MNKFIGKDVISVNKGYFGVRYCEECKKLQACDLVDLKAVYNFAFVPIKTYAVKRVLQCPTCKACFFISDDQWEHYLPYLHKRLNEKTTWEVFDKLDIINNSLLKQGVTIDIKNEKCFHSLDQIVDGLAKKYGHPETLSEIVSVYYSKK